MYQETTDISMNKTSEVYTVTNGANETGQPVFSVLVKRTYNIIDRLYLQPARVTSELRKIDEFYDGGDPFSVTVKFEKETAAFKPATDVVFIGKAYVPEGEACTEMDVSVEVGSVAKNIHVFGDRHCRYRKGLSPVISDPEPFTSIDIRYERSYGGKDEKSNPQSPFFYPRNYQGTGIAIKNQPDTIENLPMPNFEDPLDLLTPDRIVLGTPERWVSQPMPQGFGWYSPAWYPRSLFVGSIPAFMDIDCLTAEEQAGLVPVDHVKLARRFKLPAFDVRFNNGASPGLAVPYLSGGEIIRIINMSADGEIRFTLPSQQPAVKLDIGIGGTVSKPVIQTVCVRTEDLQVDIIWQVTLPYPGTHWLPQMKKISVEVS